MIVRWSWYYWRSEILEGTLRFTLICRLVLEQQVASSTHIFVTLFTILLLHVSRCFKNKTNSLNLPGGKCPSDEGNKATRKVIYVYYSYIKFDKWLTNSGWAYGLYIRNSLKLSYGVLNIYFKFVQILILFVWRKKFFLICLIFLSSNYVQLRFGEWLLFVHIMFRFMFWKGCRKPPPTPY